MSNEGKSKPKKIAGPKFRICRCEGYGFQAVYSGIGYIIRGVWVKKRISFSNKLIVGLCMTFADCRLQIA